MDKDDYIMINDALNNLEKQIDPVRKKLGSPKPKDPQLKIRCFRDEEEKRFLFVSRTRIYTTIIVLIVVIWYLLTR